MIRLETITIREFRGIRDLTLNFKGRNYAVCGPNGTGKSGVVDAIEFALTGSISRLTGDGRGEVSVKDHAPHVDSRNSPAKALVTLTFSAPALGKTITISRSVASAKRPVITPSAPDVLALIATVEAHPEIVLSRRELIKYVLAPAGERAKEVQELLRLDDIETVRAGFEKIANASAKTHKILLGEKSAATDGLVQRAQIANFNGANLLAAVNQRRTVLGLASIPELSATTTFTDGLATPAASPVGGPATRVNKVHAQSDIKLLLERLSFVVALPGTSQFATTLTLLKTLAADEHALRDLSRQALYVQGLKFIDGEYCPLCDLAWDAAALREHLRVKLERLAAVAKQRANVEVALRPISTQLVAVRKLVQDVAALGASVIPKCDVAPLLDVVNRLDSMLKKLDAVIPVADVIAALEMIKQLETGLATPLDALTKSVALLPEPSQLDAARDYLTACQERLDVYRATAKRCAKAEQQSQLSAKVRDSYAAASKKVLEGVYASVQGEFARLYSLINKDDEADFEARLVPSYGKLSFDVDFYGKGFFPPGAYHSEGHQDGMGLCLYLALMRYLLKDDFTVAVLDDVLMSVDSGHRRAVCDMLRAEFPKTQFIMTTHDRVWLEHMKTVGLITRSSSIHFKTWTVTDGPKEWSEKDTFDEIAKSLTSNDVPPAAATLRRFLEYLSAEVCGRLHAMVVYQGDAQHSLGDLMPSAIARLRSLYSKAKESANSWNRREQRDEISTRAGVLSGAVAKSQAEQWQTNAAVHFNTWAELQPADFAPVAKAFEELIESFRCSECQSLLYVVVDGKHREQDLRCQCGKVTYNLVVKP